MFVHRTRVTLALTLCWCPAVRSASPDVQQLLGLVLLCLSRERNIFLQPLVHLRGDSKSYQAYAAFIAKGSPGDIAL